MRPRVSSIFGASLAVLGSMSAAISWLKMGNVSDLLFAIAGVAIAPVWYARPLQLTASIRALKPGLEPAPLWAHTLNTIFLTLLGASLVVRWAA